MGDKTKIKYIKCPSGYKRKVANEVTKFCMTASNPYIKIINKEAKDIINITNIMDIGDKVRTLNERAAFLTLKGKKADFRSCPRFRLINHIKTELEVISNETIT